MSANVETRVCLVLPADNLAYQTLGSDYVFALHHQAQTALVPMVVHLFTAVVQQIQQVEFKL